MGQALYRKYRSKSFDEVIGQEHITTTLRNALQAGRLSHAYLFTGPRGVGKTSVARILAHEVNGLEYLEDSVHLDIIEIDAASNRRIDEIRELRERVHTAPASAKYKVYIIDEVHMLTREAFNALLKTLEEPPEHCIFVLATTEAHKLPETIISRTQRFSFRPVNVSKTVAHLANIAKKEGISIDQKALELIAEHGEGSFRDSIGMLDQLAAFSSKVTLEDARQLLGLAPKEAIDELLESVAGGNSREVLRTITALKEQGASASKVAGQVGKELRNRLLDGEDATWLAELLRQLVLVPAAPNPFEMLEISVLEAAARNRKGTSDNEVVSDDTKKIAKQPDVETVESEESVEVEEYEAETVETPPKVEFQVFDVSLWPNVVSRIKSEAASLYTALRLASPRMDGGKLVLAFQFPLHQKKVSQAKNIDIIGKTIEKVTGARVTISCVVDKSVRDDQENGELESVRSGGGVSDELSAISNIFGGAEVLES